MARKLLFIINPNAGKKNSAELIKIIRLNLPHQIEYEIIVWKDKNHFEEINTLIRSEQYTDAIAVGGDGTVNQVAKTLLFSNICLGIIPLGSGNGLARSLGISLNTEKALNQIIQGKKIKIDSGNVNGNRFFCTSGIGFDAQIANLFAAKNKRGVKTYIKISLSELFKYRSKEYTLNFNNQTIKRKAFLICVANIGQYGNDVFIAPQADMQDGLFHIVIIKPFKLYQFPYLLLSFLRKKTHLSNLVEIFTTTKITIIKNENNLIHYDGEPHLASENIVFENIPNSLNVIIG